MRSIAFLPRYKHTLLQIAVRRDSISANFIVQADEQPQKTVVEFAPFGDVSFVEKWRETLGTTPEAIQREAADLAQLARERYLADSRVGQRYMAAPQELQDHIARDPQCEVAGLVLLKCEWFADSQIIGLCHFRRTWCNNIVVDYLAKHPLTFLNSRIKGIGPSLRHTVCPGGYDASLL